MANGDLNIDYSQYEPEVLEASFLEARETLAKMRRALLMKGYWIDAKYNIKPVAELEDSHITSILKLMKNKAILKAKSHKGLEELTWPDFIVEEPAYKSLFTEAQDRNLPGISRFPTP